MHQCESINDAVVIEGKKMRFILPTVGYPVDQLHSNGEHDQLSEERNRVLAIKVGQVTQGYDAQTQCNETQHQQE